MFRYTKWTFIREVLVWVASLIALSPLFFLVNISLKSFEEYDSSIPFELVKQPSLDAFIAVFSSDSGPRLLIGLGSSALITTIAVSGLIFFGSVTAYILVRRTSRLSKASFYMVLTGILVPAQIGLVPIYIGAKALGLLGNPIGMGVIYIGMLMPLAIFLYSGFVRSLPTEYEEAAVIDGSKPFRTFMSIVFPLLAPATGTVAIMTGIIVWNDFFTPLIFMAGSDTPTIGLAVYSLVDGFLTYWNKIFAILIVAMLPVTILYLVFQKKFIQGFAGGMKG